MSQRGFGQFADLFRRSDLLPQLPEAAIRLVRTIDGGDTNAILLERLVSADPALVASLLKTANSSSYGLGAVTTIRSAITRLGTNAVRTLAISFAIQALLSRPSRRCSFDSKAFVRHSLYVSFRARQVLLDARGQNMSIEHSPDEAFAAGMVHDLPVALLSRIAPDAFDRIAFVAQQKGLPFAPTFETALAGRLGDLGAIAIEAWGLPSLFSDAVYLASVNSGMKLTPFWQALRDADTESYTYGFGLESWLLGEPARSEDLPPEVDECSMAVAEFLDGFSMAA